MQRDPRFTFDHLVVGTGNRLAASAARAVAESPGTVYTPLFIYGGSGLGKTHLLSAIGALARTLQPALEMECLTLEEFAAQLHAAVSAGQVDAFAGRHERMGLLLLDDVQDLAGLLDVQAELSRLLERMQEAGGQAVFASDRLPAAIPDVDARLVSQLSAGLVVDVAAPDYETRIAILRAGCEERRLECRTGVLEELARFSFSNVRALQGALKHLVDAGAVTGRESAPAPDAVRGAAAESEPAAVAPTEPAPETIKPTAAGRAGAAAARPHRRPTGEFASFVSEVTTVVQQQVEAWQARLREAIAYWNGEGYRTAVLERALALTKAPDVAGLLATFNAAVEHLRELERAAVTVDHALGRDPVFRDPERTAEAEDLVERALVGDTPPPGPSAAFTRESFETGSSNQLAVQAADAVSKSPGDSHNPLLIYGSSGVGKTHLLHAIGNALRHARGPRFVVSCVNGQQFVDELAAATAEGTLSRWRGRYRAVDALLLDDLQFVGDREPGQHELFLLFNDLVGAGKQVVLSSDLPPAAMPGLEARLRSRFEGGLVVPMQSPDRALREKLFARFLAAAGHGHEAHLLLLLSQHPAQSVREIMGVVNRLGAAARAAGTPVDASLVRRELGAVTPNAGIPSLGAAAEVRDPAFLDPEKIVWEWPEVSARVIEEFR